VPPFACGKLLPGDEGTVGERAGQLNDLRVYTDRLLVLGVLAFGQAAARSGGFREVLTATLSAGLLQIGEDVAGKVQSALGHFDGVSEFGHGEDSFRRYIG